MPRLTEIRTVSCSSEYRPICAVRPMREIVPTGPTRACVLCAPVNRPPITASISLITNTIQEKDRAIDWKNPNVCGAGSKVTPMTLFCCSSSQA